MLRAYHIALQFMTTLPVPSLTAWREDDMRRSVQAYPLVGLTLGALLLLVSRLSQFFTPFIQATLLLAAWLGLTGALHFDGYCDTADAAFSSKSISERQAIAKSPEIGAFALAAAVVLLLIKVAALRSLYVWQWLIIIPLLARTLVVIPMHWFALGTHSSLGQRVRPNRTTALAALGLGLVLATVFGVSMLGDFLTLLVLTTIVIWLLAQWLRARMGGLSGDSYGFLIEASEAFMLLLATVL